MDGDDLFVYVYHDMPENDPFEKPGYSYTVLMMYPRDTNQSIIRYYAKKMCLEGCGLIVFPCVLSDGVIECSHCIGLGIGIRQALRIADRLEEPLALHLMETVVRDCCGQLKDEGYDMELFDDAVRRLWKRADDAMRSYRERNAARLKARREENRKTGGTL